jgi:TP901 family phage tail tape measure protein
MPDVKRTIEMVFAGTDELSDKIATITKSFDKSQISIDKFAEPLAGATEQLLKLEAAVVAAGLALGLYAANEAVKFQDANTGLDQVLGETTRSMDSFSDSALTLSNTFGVAAVEVTESFAAFSSAGFAADEVEGLTESVLKFSVASKVDATVATEGLVRILKGFNAEATLAPAILDQITANTDKYATNVDQMTEALARSAPIAKQSNLSIAETLGVLTPIVEVFQSAEMASTAFNAVMQRLTSDNANVIEGLGKLKVAQLDSNGSMRTAKDILLDVQKAFVLLDPTQKAVTANLLAGAEHTAKFSLVFDNLAKTSAATAQALAGVGTAVDHRLQKRMEDTSYAMGLIATQFQNVAIIAGGAFLTGINSAGAGLSVLALTLQDLAKSEPFQAFAATVTAELARAGTAVEAFATALPAALQRIDLEAFQEQLRLLGISFDALFEGIDLTTPEGLAAALQKIVDIGTQVIAFNRGLVDGFAPVIEAFKLLFTVVTALPSEVLALTGVVAGLSVGWTLLSPAISLATSTLGGFGKLIGVGGELLKGIEAASAATTLLGTSFVATTGYIALAAAGGYAFGTAVNTYLLDPLAKATTGFDSFGAAIADLVHGPGEELNINAQLAGNRIAALAAETARATGTTQDFTSAFSATLDAVISGVGPLEALATNTKRVSDSQFEMVSSLAQLNLSLNLVNDAFLTQSNLGSTTVEGFRLIDGVYTNLDASGQVLAQTTETLGKAQAQTAKEVAQLALESEKLALEWEKLRAGEREITFTATVDLQIAQFEQQADQFKAIIESLDTAIKSTGETLLGLSKLFLESQTKFGGTEIAALLRAEEERRKKNFELQEKLINAQLKYLHISTDKLAKGEAIITINADGLEPELKMVLFKIIELAHVEASGAAGPMLLGLPNL